MNEPETERQNVAPGTPHDSMLTETISYVIGLALALILTGVSFWVASTSTLWGPGVAVGLVVLAIVIGFPIALVIAWAFELTPEGLKRTEDVDLAASARQFRQRR